MRWLRCLVFAAPLASACQEEPPTYPSALVEIATDVPVPNVVSRIQVDVYDEHGRWVQHRRFAVANASEMPSSFGIAMRDDTRPTSVLVRVRAHAEGAERDYRGERFVGREPYAPIPTASSLAELCASAQDLPRDETRLFHVGPTPLFPTTCDQLDNIAGSAAATITVKETGRYRVGVLPFYDEESSSRVAAAPTVHLVRDCMRPGEATGCDASFSDSGPSSVVERDLEPGTYAIVTGAWHDGSVGLVALRWSRAEDWSSAPRPLLPARTSDDPSIGVLLALEGAPTPASEPAPDATIDRLVRLDLRPGEPVRARLVLHGACAGTMAKLHVEDGRVDAARSMTCVDAERRLAPVPSGGDAVAEVTPFAGDPCVAEDSSDEVVCVPGGVFVLGGSGSIVPGTITNAPKRIVALRRFFLDRHEYTVGRYRRARARGLRHPRPDLLAVPSANEGVLDGKTHDSSGTWSEAPRGREDHPLNRIIWSSAREACRFDGGDLPTEAQWEYAATYAPTGKRALPWGSVPATCEMTVAWRDPSARLCPGPPLVPITSDELAGDVSYLGIRALGGSLREMVLDTPRRYDDRCFRGAPLFDPVCLDPAEPGRVTRGPEWRSGFGASSSLTRHLFSLPVEGVGTGFRCAYRERPEAR